MKIFINFLVINILILPMGAFSAAPIDKGYVVLLHGLARSASSMSELEEFMVKDGYKVINIDYPSTTDNIDYSVNFVAKELDAHKEEFGKKKVHFITHSLGGIVLRKYFKENKFPNLGRVVMMAPPNGGCEIVDFYENNPLMELALGPTFYELGTRKEGFITKLGKVNFELGVIAGNSTLNPVFSGFMLPGDDDGKVTIESTKVEGMKDHIVVDASHVFIMSDEVAMNQALYFIESGEFYREEKTETNTSPSHQ